MYCVSSYKHLIHLFTQERKNELQAVRKESRYQQEQRQLAESERQSLQDFEAHLTLARIQV